MADVSIDHYTHKRRLEPGQERILTIREAAILSSLSEDTIRRKFRACLIKVSARRFGVRLSDIIDHAKQL